MFTKCCLKQAFWLVVLSSNRWNKENLEMSTFVEVMKMSHLRPRRVSKYHSDMGIFLLFKISLLSKIVQPSKNGHIMHFLRCRFPIFRTWKIPSIHGPRNCRFSSCLMIFFDTAPGSSLQMIVDFGLDLGWEFFKENFEGKTKKCEKVNC